MSTDLKEWVVDRGEKGGPRRYLQDHMVRNDEEVLLWTESPRSAWRLEKRDAAAYAQISYYKAEVIHEEQMPRADKETRHGNDDR